MSADLPPIPPGFASTREAMHRLAEDVIKPFREFNTGEFPLIRTPGGFGIPEFGGGNSVRVEGTELVVAGDGQERRAPITSLRGAGEFIDPGLLARLPELPDDPLEIDPAAAEALAASYRVGEAALERLIEDADPDDAPTSPTLWPEHFDLAIESGPEDEGLRANYGMSPGDAGH